MKSCLRAWALGVGFGALMSAGAFAQSAGDAIKIGIVQAQTGPLADAFGIPEAEGTLLAIDEINAKGGIAGHKFEVVRRDDRTAVQPTVIAFQELVRDPAIIAIVGPTTSGASMAVRPIINENKIPELGIAYGTALTASNFQYFYRIGPSLDTGNQALLTAIQKHRGAGQKLATLVLSDAGGTEGARNAVEHAPSFGIAPVDSENYKYGDTDFTAQLSKIKAAGATALLSLTQGVATNAMARGVKQLGMDGLMIVGPNGLADPQAESLAGDLINGVVFWDFVCLDDPSNKELPAIRAAYQARFNKPLSNGAINGYDAMRMIAVSLQKLADEKKPLTREGLNDELNHLTFMGVGSKYEFTSEWHNGPHVEQIPMCTYQSGKRVPWTP